MGRESEFILWDGPDDLVLSRPSVGAAWRRPAGISFPNLDHAERLAWGNRAGDRRPRRAHVQRSHLQHLRALAWSLAHTLVGATQRGSVEEQSGWDQGSRGRRRRAGTRHETFAPFGRLRW